MSDNTNEPTKCANCEETVLDGETTCQPCRDHQAALRSDDQTNALIHYITGGEFL
jgi:hypothetical protein